MILQTEKLPVLPYRETPHVHYKKNVIARLLPVIDQDPNKVPLSGLLKRLKKTESPSEMCDIPKSEFIALISAVFGNKVSSLFVENQRFEIEVIDPELKKYPQVNPIKVNLVIEFDTIHKHAVILVEQVPSDPAVREVLKDVPGPTEILALQAESTNEVQQVTLTFGILKNEALTQPRVFKFARNFQTLPEIIQIPVEMYDHLQRYSGFITQALDTKKTSPSAVEPVPA